MVDNLLGEWPGRAKTRPDVLGVSAAGEDPSRDSIRGENVGSHSSRFSGSADPKISGDKYAYMKR